MRARMEIGPGSMAAWWMVGREVDPAESAEICVVEVFGDRPRNIGMGLHPFRDRRVRDDFAAPFVDIDVAEFHTYGVEWSREKVEFFIDDRMIAAKRTPPAYPMQQMIAVFDFPDEKPTRAPALVIDVVRGFA
jgi:beta-glucanase (GH16 family)